jgi:17 kDa outer membrane surface antigen
MSAGGDLSHRAGARERRLQSCLPARYHAREKEGADQGDPLGSAAPQTAAELPAEGDLAIARAAVSEVLSKGASSMPWENPQTGARGTVTPLASVYNQAGIACRDFLASFVKNGSETWLQGAACRAKRGKWEVRNLRPWSNT